MGKLYVEESRDWKGLSLKDLILSQIRGSVDLMFSPGDVMKQNKVAVKSRL